MHISVLFSWLGFVLACLTVTWPSMAYAQLDVGINIGASTYTGELAPERITQQLQQLRFSYGAHLRYQFANWAAVRANYQDLDLGGSDQDRKGTKSRNLSFYTDLDELSLLLEIYPLGSKGVLSPYLVGGVAYYRFSPVAYLEGKPYRLQPLGTEGQGLPGFEAPYKLTQLAVPLGIGIRVQISPTVLLGLEGSGRITSTDYLDDVSGRYVDESVLIANGPLAVELAYRGDELEAGRVEANAVAGSLRGTPDTKDFYYTFTFSLAYRLPTDKFGGRRGAKALPCPKF